MSRTTETTEAPAARPSSRRARRTRRRLVRAGVAGALTLALAMPAVAARDDLTLASRPAAGGPSEASSDEAALSGDGNVVVFESSGDGFSADDDNAVQNVYARDMATGAVTLVSRATGLGAPGGSEDSGRAAVSADGRMVAFSSLADSLSAEDVDTVRNVFVRNLQTGVTTLVSRANGAGGAAADGESDLPAISADGRYVAFHSVADNLSADNDDNYSNTFVRDVVGGTTTLVSRATGFDGAGADNGAGSSSISADGRFVAFDSSANNLSAEDADAVRDVFVRDVIAGTTTLVSRATGAGGAGGDAGSYFPSISADGRVVTFDSAADNLSGADDDTVDDVFVRDLAAGTTTLASRAQGPAGAGGDGASERPAISGNGRMVAFASEADNLSAADDDAVADVFVRDIGPATGAGQGPGGPGTGRGGGPTTPAKLVRCAGARATIVGTAGRDLVRGTPRRDVIAALAGNDRVLGLGGNDLICLGAGADRAAGGRGADRILGGPGADRIRGDAGRDLLLGGAGRDLLVGGAGRDRLVGGAGRDGVTP